MGGRLVMNNLDRASSVVRYYVLCNRLKNIIRTGWKSWKVSRERLESVAEHIFGVQSLAIAMHSQYNYDLDLYKVVFMLAVHELEEVIIGDLTYWDISQADKIERGHEAVLRILEGILEKDQIVQLVFEFDKRETPEAKFAYHCDKLECDLQCKIYDEEGCVDLDNQEGNQVFWDKDVQKIINDGESTWSGMWLEYDRSKYLDDANFGEVLDYVKVHDISSFWKEIDN